MASLSGQNPSSTFPSLIKTINNNPVSASLIQLSDGNGVGIPINVSTNNVFINSPLTASTVTATNNGNGTNFRVGDDVWIGDVNIANTMQVRGIQDATKGYVKFGSGSSTPIVGGTAGTNTLELTGSLNVSGTIVGSIASASYSVSSSLAQTASYVANAISSSRAISAANADTASFVTTAQTASYVANAVSASRATSTANADTASFVATAQTASYVLNAVSASIAVSAATASYVAQAISASYALTASYALNGGGTSIDTGSFATTGSNTFIGYQVIEGGLNLSSADGGCGLLTEEVVATLFGDEGITLDVSASNLGRLQEIYIEALALLQDTFDASTGDPGYDWGVTQPLGPQTYQQLLDYPAGPDAPPLILVNSARTVETAYENLQDGISTTNVSIEVSSSAWLFRSDGVMYGTASYALDGPGLTIDNGTTTLTGVNQLSITANLSQRSPGAAQIEINKLQTGSYDITLDSVGALELVNNGVIKNTTDSETVTIVGNNLGAANLMWTTPSGAAASNPIESGELLHKISVISDGIYFDTNISESLVPHSWYFGLDGTSQFPGLIYGTASYALTASYLLGAIESASYASFAEQAATASYLLGTIESASYALTASYALNGGGTSIDTGSFATTGSNTFFGDQTVSGSLLLTGNISGALALVDNVETFTSQVNFVPSSSGDGYGLSTIELRPDIRATSDQYLIIDPTAPSHIHIRAGGTQDNSAASLIIGGETSNFAIPAGLNSSPYISSNNNVWRFVEDGTIVFPDFTVQSTAFPGTGSFATTGSNTFNGDQVINGSLNQGSSNTVSGVVSHAEGVVTTAFGTGSHSEGYSTNASGSFSHAEGISTLAIGAASHAEGSSTLASGDASHAEGDSTIAAGLTQHVQGAYNISRTDRSAFILGNGTSDSTRSNLIFASGSVVEISGSLAVSGSIIGAIQSASYALTASFLLGSIESASYAINSDTASFVVVAQTASYVLNAVSASRATSALSSSFAATSSYAIVAVIANTSQNANFATTASFATSSITAQTASFVATASWASNASNASLAATVNVVNIGIDLEYGIPFMVTGSGQVRSLFGDVSSGMSYNPSTKRTRITTLLATGSLFGTSSWASNAISASFITTAQTASYVLNAVSASFANTASFALTANNFLGSASFATTGSNTFTGNQTIQGLVSASVFSTGDQVKFGVNAGATNQAQYGIAIGSEAGLSAQAIRSIAIGAQSGKQDQGSYSVAIGDSAGLFTQGGTAVAIGSNAGFFNQGSSGIAIGQTAGGTDQGANAVAIGYLAGQASQGQNSIAIGAYAGSGSSNQADRTIILNASGTGLSGVNGQTDSLYIDPIRIDTGSVANTLYYNTATKEITYSTNEWISAGTIQSVGWSATTTAPTIGSTSRNNISYRRVSNKNWEVSMVFDNLSGGSNGTGDYIFTLPGGLTFDTTLPSQVIYTSGVGTNSWSNADFAMPASGLINNGTVGGQVYPVVYSSNTFRVLTTTFGTGIQFWSGAFYQLGGIISMTFRLITP